MKSVAQQLLENKKEKAAASNRAAIILCAHKVGVVCAALDDLKDFCTRSQVAYKDVIPEFAVIFEQLQKDFNTDKK